MIRIIDKRATGKTSRLLLLAKEYNATIIVPNETYIRDLMKKYDIKDVDVITYGEFIFNIYHKRIGEKNYLLDEADGLFNMLGIKGYTISTEE